MRESPFQSINQSIIQLNIHCHPPSRSNRNPADSPPFPHSHCNACKLLSGSENTLNQMANEGDLKITKGETKTYTYYGDSGKLHTCSLCSPSPLPPFPPRLFLHPPTPTSLNRSSYPLPSIGKPFPPFLSQKKPGKPVNCYYCPNCTSHIYHHQTVLGPKIVVRTALLKASDAFPVKAEIFGKDRLGWQKEIAQTFPGPPE